MGPCNYLSANPSSPTGDRSTTTTTTLFTSSIAIVIIITTADHADNPQALSPRAREKRPARDVEPPPSDLPLRGPWPPASADLSQGSTSPTRPFPQRSFLDTFRSRPVQRLAPQDLKQSASRVLNPINYVPRPTPVTLPRKDTAGSPKARYSREAHTLLTLPEQRRSRQHSPTSPIVEHSPRLDPTSSNRTSIGLPSNHQRSPLVTPTGDKKMVDLEKAEDGTREPEKVRVPQSKYNTQDRDIESHQPPTGSVLGQTYGVAREDQPLQPPRRITSLNSLRQKNSSVSLRSGQPGGPSLPPPSVDGGGTTDQVSVADELAWGPSHPCFPHLNAHVPLNSPEYKSTRIIRIRRDWMVKGDLAPTYSNIYPEILDPLLPEQEFRAIVQHINESLVKAFDPYSAWNWLDGFLGVVTGWLWEDLRPGGVKRKLRGLEAWIQDWNRTVGSRDGVKIIPLRRTGYMNLDIQIPDPQIRVVGEQVDDRSRPGTGLTNQKKS